MEPEHPKTQAVARKLVPGRTKSMADAVELVSDDNTAIDDGALQKMEEALAKDGVTCVSKGSCIILMDAEITPTVIRNLAQLYDHAASKPGQLSMLYRLFFISDRLVVRLRYYLGRTERPGAWSLGDRGTSRENVEKIKNIPGFMAMQSGGGFLFQNAESWIFAHRDPREPQVQNLLIPTLPAASAGEAAELVAKPSDAPAKPQLPYPAKRWILNSLADLVSPTVPNTATDVQRAIPLVRLMIMTGAFNAPTGPVYGYWGYMSLGPGFTQYQALADAYTSRNVGATVKHDEAGEHAWTLQFWLRSNAIRHGKQVTVTIPEAKDPATTTTTTAVTAPVMDDKKGGKDDKKGKGGKGDKAGK